MATHNPPTDSRDPDEPEFFAPAIDARAMKAFAHPLRMAMYDYLVDHEAATATMLARHTGESTGQTSYHLRQLERHGFVTEDPGRGSGRERWWRSVGFRMDGFELAQDAGTRPAVEAVLSNQVAGRARQLADWYARSESEPLPWQTATTNSTITSSLTLDEMRDLRDALMTVLHEHVTAAKDRRENAEAQGNDAETRRVRVYLDVFPLPED
ncbi:ArsR/SmtB family transcription factor [Georgenia sp. Z1344]|uniref:ArsR/SmtB family transcription factor n=1 Tax=Georgenia sp. Z1344 TaxID=3416706 RepID=UPI003CECB382